MIDSASYQVDYDYRSVYRTVKRAAAAPCQ